jgi:acetyl esterase/lipase
MRYLSIRSTTYATGLLIAALTASAAFAADAPAKNPATSPPAPKFKRVMPQTPPGISMGTYTIATYGGKDVTLVVYVPDKPGVYPAILDIHGGGWKDRQVENDKPMMERLASRGFVTALVAYRLSGDAKYPAALTDCKSAVRYLRANSGKFKIDPDRIGVMGGSAGGHLSGLLAMTSGLPEFEGDGPNPGVSSAVKAAIVMAATMDLSVPAGKKSGALAVAFFGDEFSAIPDVYKAASPITHVRAGVPPTIFIEGEKDGLKFGRSEMQEKLRALGIETSLHTLKDAPHPFWMSQPWLDETVEIATAFFKKHLGEPKVE